MQIRLEINEIEERELAGEGHSRLVAVEEAVLGDWVLSSWDKIGKIG